MFYAIDLFCGAGGMSEGILQAGFHILYSNDINESVEATYMNRHQQLGYRQGINTFFRRADIRELNGNNILNDIDTLEMWHDIPRPDEIDVIFGGPPCQGFSLAGRRNADDPRNMLFREYIRIIDEIRPKYVVMENVVGFMNTRLQNFIGHSQHIYEVDFAPDILTQELELIGYSVLNPRILDASDFGVPQSRKRAIFIAYRNDVIEPEYPVASENRVTIKDAIGDLIHNEVIRENINPTITQYQMESMEGRTPNIEGDPISSDGVYNNNECSNHSMIISQRFSLYQEGESTFNLKERIKKDGINLNNNYELVEFIAKKVNLSHNEIVHRFKIANVDDELITLLLTKKNMRRRLNSNSTSSTVVSLPDDFISPFENRTFSVREMARLQSFDDSFRFLGPRTTGGDRRKAEVPQYTQVGNAVPPLLAKAVALKINEALVQTNNR